MLFTVKNPRRRKCRPRKQVYKGVRFSVCHRLFGREDVQCRTWSGLEKALARYRSKCLRAGIDPARITVVATDDEGRLWRPMTRREMADYVKWHSQAKGVSS